MIRFQIPPSKPRDDGSYGGGNESDNPDETDRDDDAAPTCGSSYPNSSNEDNCPSNGPNAKSPRDGESACPNTTPDSTSDTVSRMEKSPTDGEPSKPNFSTPSSTRHEQLRRKGAPTEPKAMRSKPKNIPKPSNGMIRTPQNRPSQPPAPRTDKPNFSIGPDLAEMFRSRISKDAPGKE